MKGLKIAGLIIAGIPLYLLLFWLMLKLQKYLLTLVD